MGILKGAKNSRSQSAEIRQFQNTANRIENGENDAATIDSALGHAKTMFKGTAAEKLFDEALAEAGTDLNKRRALADILLRKTSGGDKSHEIAKSFREGAGYDATRQKVIDYYSPRSKSNPEGRNIADVFANSYASVGLDRASIMNLLNAMLPAGADVKTSTLGSHASHGFMAMEAYHQGKGAFKRLDTVHHHNAEVFGQPAEVTNKAQADKIRAELASRLPADQVRDEMQRYIAQKPEEANNPNLEQQVRQMLVAGPVYSYLSFEQDAECFNLGFFVKPGNNKWQKPSEPLTNSVGTGAVVGSEVAIKTELGLGFGMKKTPKDEPPTTTPGEGTAATIAGAKGREIGEVAGNLTKSTADAVAKNVTSGNLMDDILKGF